MHEHPARSRVVAPRGRPRRPRTRHRRGHRHPTGHPGCRHRPVGDRPRQHTARHALSRDSRRSRR
ncbi:MAG: hypothetical protein EPO52_14980 [Herbiconiux sp.]|nr:MAG: hypothetical protein EPO52_14980 [Herbiconiux sp.]